LLVSIYGFSAIHDKFFPGKLTVLHPSGSFLSSPHIASLAYALYLVIRFSSKLDMRIIVDDIFESFIHCITGYRSAWIPSELFDLVKFIGQDYTL